MTLAIRKKVWFSLLLSLALCQNTLFIFIKYFFEKIPILENFAFLVIPMLYLILFLLSFDKKIFSFILPQDLLFLGLVGISIGLTYVIYPNNGVYISKVFFEDIFPCFPFFLIGLCYSADRETNKIVGIFSCISIFISSIYLVYFMSTRELSLDNMYWSYLLLPNTMFAINYFFSEKKLLGFFGSIGGIVYAFIMGTRGPIVILAVYFCVCVWRALKWKTNTKIIAIFIVFGLLVTFMMSPLYINILNFLKDTFNNWGLSTRIFDFLISNELISYTSGRDEIYDYLLNKLSDRPFIGYGIYGEWTFGFATAHNMYLEILFHFGYILGTLLLLCLLFVSFNALVKCKDKYYIDVILIYVCFVFVQGFFGGSYLRPGVFFLIGICLRAVRANKQRIKKLKEEKNYV